MMIQHNNNDDNENAETEADDDDDEVWLLCQFSGQLFGFPLLLLSVLFISTSNYSKIYPNSRAAISSLSPSLMYNIQITISWTLSIDAFDDHYDYC